MAKEEKQSFSYPEQKIVDVDIEKRVKKSFIEYSMSVIVSRALPDVRDGLKPSQRRIMYAMYEDHLTHDKPFRKSATTVGNVLGRYHPHGDASVYGTMVRMAQDFSLRYPLIEGHGNFGSVDGDPPAAYRYTEARMSKIADEMMSDIEKNVVKFVPNFDNRMQEPSVLPSRIPNLLVNGSVGIAIGMATNIPPHNLGEVIDAAIYRMENPECTVDDLIDYIKGPDFPTKAIIYGKSGIFQAYRTGMGRIYVRARAEINEEKRQITVTEIPYAVNKSLLVENMADLIKDKKIEGIRDIRDLSSDREGGIRIVIDCKQDANCQVVLNQLYKYTQMQTTCAINMLALVNNEPKVLSLPEILDHYIEHQENVIINRTKYDLEKAQNRCHILEGYSTAIDNIDRVIEIMKTSLSIPESKVTLMNEFGLTDPQSQAIVEMTLGRLTGLERKKIEDEIERLHGLIKELNDILSDINKVKEIIHNELNEIRRKYADPRRTEIAEAEDEIDIEDLIPRHTAVITVTNGGYIKRQPADTYVAQHRGGKGIVGMKTKEEDFVEKIIVANSHANLMMFTNIGKVYTKKVYRIPEASRTAKGTNIVNILELAENEKITAVIAVSEFSDKEYLTMVTKNGVIKRTLLSEYEYQRKGGKIALTLDEGDELLFVRHTMGDEELVIASKKGMAVRFEETNARSMGRTARGVRGIRLANGDEVVGVAVVDEEKKLLTLTRGGFGKRSDFSEFRTMLHRGGVGVTCHRISDKTGDVASIATVGEDDDIMVITNDGTIIRTPVSGIPVYSRSAGGVIVMRLSEDSSIVTFARIEKEEEIEAEAEKAEEKNKNAPAVQSPVTTMADEDEDTPVFTEDDE